MTQREITRLLRQMDQDYCYVTMPITDPRQVEQAMVGYERYYATARTLIGQGLLIVHDANKRHVAKHW